MTCLPMTFDWSLMYKLKAGYLWSEADYCNTILLPEHFPKVAKSLSLLVKSISNWIKQS